MTEIAWLALAAIVFGQIARRSLRGERSGKKSKPTRKTSRDVTRNGSEIRHIKGSEEKQIEE